MVLRPIPSFLPKLVSLLHLNGDVVLPSPCPAPKHIVLPIACSRGYPAFCSTIARWIRQLVSRWITQFLTLGPLQNRAHAIRSVGVSWAYSRIKHQYLRFARWSSHDLQVLRSECSGLIKCKLCLEGALMFPSLETCFVKSTTWDYVVLGLVPGTLHYNYI